MPATELRIGELTNGPAKAEVLLRGDKIVLRFTNEVLGRAAELDFTPDAAEKLNDILTTAIRVARGRG